MYRLSFQSLDMTAAYSSLFELLWYSQLPCFDVEHYTSTHRDHRWGGGRLTPVVHGYDTRPDASPVSSGSH